MNTGIIIKICRNIQSSSINERNPVTPLRKYKPGYAD